MLQRVLPRVTRLGVRCGSHGPSMYELDPDLRPSESLTPVQRRMMIKSHMDCLPGPTGPYKTEFAKRDRVYNMNIALSAGLLAVGLYVFFFGAESFIVEDTKAEVDLRKHYHDMHDLRKPYYLEVVEKEDEDEE